MTEQSKAFSPPPQFHNQACAVQEPAAWYATGGAFTQDKYVMEAWRAAGLELTPLYTSPPDHTEAIRVLAEALKRLVCANPSPAAMHYEDGRTALYHPAVQAVIGRRG